MPLKFAYYCSGHGYGHATRVVAVTLQLLLRGHSVIIVSNAPSHIFTGAIEKGATYRNAAIDAGIVQPKAYTVDRRQTLDGLNRFLESREAKLQEECAFLREATIDVILVDAPFLPWFVCFFLSGRKGTRAQFLHFNITIVAARQQRDVD